MEHTETDLAQLEELINLLEQRDQAVKHLTFQIFDKIGPTLLECLFELFELPVEDVDWVDVQVSDGILLVICTISYDPNQPSPFIQKLFPPTPIDQYVAKAHKMIRIGVPLGYVFAPKENIIEFLQNVANKTYLEKNQSPDVEHNNKKEDNLSFNTSNLSQEQIQQMLLFTQHGKGIKH